MKKPRIAHLAGPTATIQNTPPLVTSNKARAKYGLPLLVNQDGSAPRFDVLRAQRLAAPVTVYVEQFTGHPLEADAAELYAPPDGYLDAAGAFHKERQSAHDKPVFQVEIRPEDGLYPLPYMARQSGGGAWDDDCAFPGAPADQARQGFYPDGSRSFEEIDRLEVSYAGIGNMISSKADVDFFRIMPPGGYTKGLPAAQRTDIGDGDIAPERRGEDFFSYRPYHLASTGTRRTLARATNAVQKILASGDYLGAVWTEGSPTSEESIYWMGLLIDTVKPICGNSAQRTQGEISNDGPKNIVDSVDYITSRVWADEQGRNKAGAVLIQEQRIFAARAVQKADARPGGYVATGGHGGILGASGHAGAPLLHYLPTSKHTWNSEVNLSRLPAQVTGLRMGSEGIATVAVPIKDAGGGLLESAIPKVSIVKDGSYVGAESNSDIEREVDLLALLDDALKHEPLSGFIVEGLTPYGTMTSAARNKLMLRALYSGMPVVRVGRGNTEGFVPRRDECIAGSNLTATKARLLLMASMMKLGALPIAKNPDAPTLSEIEATAAKVGLYQGIFDTH
ncbi:MAG: L-asparaginase [Herbaspirillum sp.]|nr:L-asparaginase [Herbaspirillum sp.]